MGIDPGKEDIMELSKGLVSGLAIKAGFTVEAAAAHGFVAQERIIRSFINELEGAIPTSPTATKAIEGASTMSEAINAIKKQTLTALTNKAIASLRERLESKAIELCAVVKGDDMVQYHGIIGYTDMELVDMDAMHINQTYSYALFTEIVLGHISPVEGLDADVHVARQVLNTILKNEAIMDVVGEFDKNFCSGLVQGEYALGFGTKYYNYTVGEGVEHQQALFATLEAAGLVQAYEDALNNALVSIMANQEIASTEEPKKEEVPEMKIEEMVMVSVAEYESLKTLESVNDRNVELMAQLNTRVKEYEAAIEGLGKQLDEKDAIIADQKVKLEEALKAQSTTKNTKEDTNMSTFRISVQSFKEVAVRQTPEDKVVSTSAIEGMDVGNVMKARVKMVDVSKGLNNAVREKSPEAIVKVTNASHTGIDAVATAAHKTTNVIAKTTNTAIQKSANAVDAVLDFVAPFESTVDMSAYKRTKEEAKDGDIVEVNGHKYEMKNGRLLVI